MKKHKYILLSLVIFLTIFISTSFASADVIFHYRESLGGDDWTSIHTYISEGDKLAVSWEVITRPETIDAWVVNQGNYSLFLATSSFEVMFTLNNTWDGYFLLEDLPEDLYFTVFNNDQPSGMTIDYQITLIEKDPSNECNCNCSCVDNPINPATITGVSTLAFGVIAAITVIAIIWKTKVKKLN